jgi:hypothetical protein
MLSSLLVGVVLETGGSATVLTGMECLHAFRVCLTLAAVTSAVVPLLPVCTASSWAGSLPLTSCSKLFTDDRFIHLAHHSLLRPWLTEFTDLRDQLNHSHDWDTGAAADGGV